MASEAVARRYAAALADVVLNTNETDTVTAELHDLAVLLDANVDLQTVFGNPAIAQANKEKVLEQLIGRLRPSKTTANFLRVLLRNGRLADLREVQERFIAEVEQRRGMVRAEVVSARPLPGAERMEFEKRLATLTGRKVNINYRIDETIIGGVITRIGSTVYDASVKTKLENLRAELAGA
jgi:F-type H+-transporting ATPase subunit delta